MKILDLTPVVSEVNCEPILSTNQFHNNEQLLNTYQQLFSVKNKLKKIDVHQKKFGNTTYLIGFANISEANNFSL